MSDIHDKLDKKLINLCLKEAPSLGDINKVSDEIIALVREHDNKYVSDIYKQGQKDERQRCIDAVKKRKNDLLDDLDDLSASELATVIAGVDEAIKGLDDE